jgi:hypothetical protein
MEKRHQSWWDGKGRHLDDIDLPDILDDLRVDEAAYLGGTRSIQAADCSDSLALLLKEEGIDPDDSPAFRQISGLLQRATLECIRRSMDRVERKPARSRDNLFRDVFAHTPPPAVRRSVTLGELIKRHAQQLSDSERSKGTHQTYAVPYRVLRETFGEQRPLEKISKDDVEQLFRLLRGAPVNAAKRYPGMMLKQAVAAADRRKDPRRLGANTLDNYFTNISAIFTFAVTKELIASNPAKDKYMRELVRSNEPSTPKLPSIN